MIAAVEGVLAQSGPWALVVVFAIIALDSSAFLGVVLPGESIALIAGAMAGADFFSPWSALAIVVAAAIMGDLCGYALGRYRGQAVLAHWAFARRQYEEHRERLEYYFEYWGTATVFVGRFVAVGRAVVPFAAGLSGMRARRFIPMAIASGTVWGALVIALGYTLGANWRIVERWFKSLGAGILVLLILTAAVVASWRWVAARQTEIAAAWNRHFAVQPGSRLEAFFDFVRARVSPRGYLGLHLTLGVIAVIGLAWLFGGIVDIISDQDPLIVLDGTVASLIANHRTAGLDSFAMALNALSNPVWLVAMVAVVATGSARAGHASLSIAAITTLAGVYALAFGLQAMFSDHHTSGFENVFAGFPSVTMTASTAAYGIVGFMLAANTSSWRWQTLGIAAALYIDLLVAIAGLYAGQTLSASLAGFALGGCWLAICVTGSLTYDRLSSPALESH